MTHALPAPLREGAAGNAEDVVLRDQVDRSFRAMGTTVRIAVSGPGAEERAAEAEALVRDYDRRLSRFRPDSELCALNADPRRRVRASALLRDAVRAALWAAGRTGGIVDPTLLRALEDAGYATSRANATPVPLDEVREWAAASPRVAARPHPDRAWAAIVVHEPTGTIVRPPGAGLDLGGTGKGHVADLVAGILDGADRWAIDCGGDLRVGGAPGTSHAVAIAGPDGTEITTLHLHHGAVATSSIHARSWRAATSDAQPRRPDASSPVDQDWRDRSGLAHHLLDPATGRPVNTGLISATALAPTVLEAETLAKAALMTGDLGWLESWGGVAVGADGDLRWIRQGVLA